MPTPAILPPGIRPILLVHRAQWFWRMCLFMPFAYVGIAALIQEHWRRNGHVPGFWPVPGARFNLLVFLLAGVALLVQFGVVLTRHRFRRCIEAAGKNLSVVARLVWLRTLWLAALSDIVSLLGLIAFLVQGDWLPLGGFCIAAYFLYAQAAPEGHIVENIRPSDAPDTD